MKPFVFKSKALKGARAEAEDNLKVLIEVFKEEKMPNTNYIKKSDINRKRLETCYFSELETKLGGKLMFCTWFLKNETPLGTYLLWPITHHLMCYNCTKYKKK